MYLVNHFWFKTTNVLYFPSFLQSAAALAEVDYEGYEVPIITIADAREASSMMAAVSECVNRGDTSPFFSSSSFSADVKLAQGKVKGGSQQHFYLETQTVGARWKKRVSSLLSSLTNQSTSCIIIIVVNIITTLTMACFPFPLPIGVGICIA